MSSNEATDDAYRTESTAERRVLLETVDRRVVWVGPHTDPDYRELRLACVYIERLDFDALRGNRWAEWASYEDGSPIYWAITEFAARLNAAASIANARDAARYRRLRVLGAAPGLSPQLQQGTVLRATGLDDFVDTDFRVVPSRGEAKEEG